MANIIIVDDHRLFREGLGFIIREMEGLNLVAEASNGKEFLELLKDGKPDLVLMDINMPVMDGAEASRKALELYPDLKILVLSMYGDDQYYNTMIDIGVKGFILKDADNKELKHAVLSILDGDTYFSQSLLLRVIRNRDQKQPKVSLSPREQEVLDLLCKGFSTQQISESLHISPRTVERHRADLLDKTDMQNSISLVIYAIKNNLVQI
jgi:DNA-binding NarL/FixJ family response regulator